MGISQIYLLAFISVLSLVTPQQTSALVTSTTTSTPPSMTPQQTSESVTSTTTSNTPLMTPQQTTESVTSTTTSNTPLITPEQTSESVRSTTSTLSKNVVGLQMKVTSYLDLTDNGNLAVVLEQIKNELVNRGLSSYVQISARRVKKIP
ncbi:hypothetical protein E1301_Tti014807 [Triplophysa tibetana]|uniref:SEA domain-containing protein n=1 Tax=Triplophysa tibetana TaxID=1572043 RepID=A0A5A9PVI1_9TELE|nr:hypothetical protein E1301_Tti014807 [Triplophysa tibetana]